MRYIKEFKEYLNENFHKWFGDSVVVDTNGNPLIVYHGSNGSFDIFKLGSGVGYKEYYFTDNFDHANDYGHSIFNVYLKLENPVILDAQGDYYDDYYDTMNSEINWARNSDEFDGVIIHNLKDPKEGKPIYDDDDDLLDYDSHTIYVVFNPNQIKSAESNNGEFSVNNDNINEATEYYQQNPDDKYDITKVSMDNGHEYKYCDGVKYELSLNGGDIVAYISEIENTPENLFYDNQIDSYVEYIKDGGILETFPVDVSFIGGARNLQEICEYLDESENFDLAWDILKKYHNELYDILSDILYSPEEYGIDTDTLKKISNVDGLDKYYGDNYDEENEDDDDLYWKEEYYLGFQTILEYWDENKEYTLTDMNHRFEAVKRLGKTMVYVDPS